MRETDANGLTVELEDRDGRWLEVLPQPLMPPPARRAPYLRIPVAAGEAPPLRWRCAGFLEDRHIDEPWHLDGVDFAGLIRAYVGRLTGRAAEGGSTISQMLARALRGVSPDPDADFFDQLRRKWVPGATGLRLRGSTRVPTALRRPPSSIWCWRQAPAATSTASPWRAAPCSACRTGNSTRRGSFCSPRQSGGRSA